MKYALYNFSKKIHYKPLVNCVYFILNAWYLLNDILIQQRLKVAIFIHNEF